MPRLIPLRVPAAVPLALRLGAHVLKANGYRGAHASKGLKTDNRERLHENGTRGRPALPRLRSLVRTVLVAAALFCTISFANAQEG